VRIWCSTWSTVDVARDHRDFKAQSALSRAVEAERTAIAMHESAARRLDELAAEMEQHALRDRDEQQQEQAIEIAAKARKRAQSARERAAAARHRLREEGFSPGR
jgi:hypothetical protein